MLSSCTTLLARTGARRRPLIISFPPTASQYSRMDFFAALLLPALANAHIASFGPGMYCKGGLTGENNQNNNLPVAPLYQLTKDKWWFQHDRGCDTAPPPAGEFLDLPVGENFTVEHGNNQAFTMLSYGGKSATDWPDGGQ